MFNYFLTIQKQPPEVFFKKAVVKKLANSNSQKNTTVRVSF